MPSTFIDLTNKLLRKVNDVEIAVSDFSSVRGVQATAKDSIVATVQEINTKRADWPFNATEATEVLVAGKTEYPWPADFNSADWSSFQILADPVLGVSYRNLDMITREQWYKYGKDLDDEAGAEGRSIPDFVMFSHGNNWAATPSPNAAYSVRYRYYRQPPELSLYDDRVTIPTRFDYVIIAGALVHMNLFKENPEGVGIIEEKFKQGIDNMIKLYYPNPEYVYTGVVNNGGGIAQRSGGYLWYKG